VLYLFANPQFVEKELKFLCDYSLALHRVAKPPLKVFVELEKAVRKALIVRGNVVSVVRRQLPPPQTSADDFTDWFFNEVLLKR
jgi:hypothetical protein